MPHTLQHPTVYTSLLPFRKHNADTTCALEARGCRVLAVAGKAVRGTGCLMTQPWAKACQTPEREFLHLPGALILPVEQNMQFNVNMWLCDLTVTAWLDQRSRRNDRSASPGALGSWQPPVSSFFISQILHLCDLHLQGMNPPKLLPRTSLKVELTRSCVTLPLVTADEICMWLYSLEFYRQKEPMPLGMDKVQTEFYLYLVRLLQMNDNPELCLVPALSPLQYNINRITVYPLW